MLLEAARAGPIGGKCADSRRNERRRSACVVLTKWATLPTNNLISHICVSSVNRGSRCIQRACCSPAVRRPSKADSDSGPTTRPTIPSPHDPPPPPSRPGSASLFFLSRFARFRRPLGGGRWNPGRDRLAWCSSFSGHAGRRREALRPRASHTAGRPSPRHERLRQCGSSLCHPLRRGRAWRARLTSA